MRISDWSSDVCSSDLQFAQVSATLFAENQKALNSASDSRPGRGGMRGGKPPANKRRRVRGGGNMGISAGRAANGVIAQYFKKPGDVADLMAEVDRKSVQEGKSESVRDDLGGRR